jgi:hypothetical protein
MRPITLVLFGIFGVLLMSTVLAIIVPPIPDFQQHGHFLPRGVVLPLEKLDCDPWTSWTTEEMREAELGAERAKRTTIVVGSLVRNCEYVFEKMQRRLEVLGSIFRRVDCLLVENDSTDGTRTILLEWREKLLGTENNNIFLTILDPLTDDQNQPHSSSLHEQFSNSTMEGMGAERIGRMVFLRNRLNRCIKQHCSTHASECEIVLITDLDLRGHWYRRGIQQTVHIILGNDDDGRRHVPAVGFRGTTEKGWLWDFYAFEPFLPDGEGYWQQLMFAKPRTREVGISHGLYDVNSCFSGGVFMKRELFFSLKREYTLETTLMGRYAVCEHVPYFRQINGGRKTDSLFCVNTNMITTHYLDLAW